MLEGYSPAIKLLQPKLIRLENALAVQNAVDVSRNEIQRLFTIYRLQQSPETENVMSSGADISSTVDDEPTLPVLKGIVKITDGFGAYDYAALVGGKVCRRNDYVMNFRVIKISPRGIVLSRSGKRWFIQTPTTYYSSDQGK